MESKRETHHIREAIKDDCPQIMEFVRLLARHGNFEDSITLDLDTLTHSAFPENERPKFKCLFSYNDNNQLSGFLAYSDTYSTWQGSSFFLLHIFIYPQFRRMGIGKKLIQEFAQIAYKERISRIRLCILGSNQSSIDFHQSLGAVNLSLKEGLSYFRINKTSIQLLANNIMESREDTHHVREAVKDDCHQIMKLIKMATHCKNIEDSEIIDVETLAYDGFTENETPKFKCLVSHDANNQLSGYLIYTYGYVTYTGQYINILDIFVNPQSRRMGIGKQMLTKLTHIADANGISIIYFLISNANQLSIDFSESIGAVNMSKSEEWYLFEFNKANIKQLAFSKD